MDFRKKTIRSYLIRIISILVASAVIILVAVNIRPNAEENQGQFQVRYDLRLWYYDDALTPYLRTLSDTYFKLTGLRVETTMVPSLEFFDTINQKNIDNDDPPDLYIIDSSKLENAFLSSLAKPNDDERFIPSDFTKKSIEACTYKDRLVAWPFSFNTAYLAYDKDIEKVPQTFEALLKEYYQTDDKKSDDEGYDAIKEYLEAHPEEKESEELLNKNDTNDNIFEFDASNLLYNSFFIGNYINLGGNLGDDAKAFDLSSEEYKKCLSFAQELNSHLNININMIDTRKVERDFIDGKVKLAVFDISSLTGLYGSGVSFDIQKIPDLNDELVSKVMSQTSVICVNPKSESSDEAVNLALYLSGDAAEGLFDNYGIMPAKNIEYQNEDMEVIKDIYESSFSLPKLIETENIWENLNGLMTSVLSGEEIERCQSKLNVAIYIALSTRTEQEDE